MRKIKRTKKVRVVNDGALTAALLTKEVPVFSELKGYESQMWIISILITFIYYM